MGKTVISENVSLDGVIEDPAGDEGFKHGGWVGRITNSPDVGKRALNEALGAEAPLAGSAKTGTVHRLAAIPQWRCWPTG